MRVSGFFRIAGVALPVALAVWLAACSGPARTEPDGPVLRVGVYENPPKIHTGSDGKPAGLFVELLEAIAREEGWRLVYQHCEWEDCLQRLQGGQLDLMPDVAYSPARSERFGFHAVPVTYSWSQVFAPRGRRIESMADLSGLRVAVLRGSVQESELQDVLRGLHVTWSPVETDAFGEAFDAVRDGRADVAVANSFYGRRSARAYDLLETPLVFSPATLYIATRKGAHAAELARIDYWLGRWHDDPRSLYFRALGRALAPLPVTVAPIWLKPVLVASSLLVLGLLAFALVLRWRVRLATADAENLRARMELVLDASPVVLFLLHQQGERLAPDWVGPNIRRLYGFNPDEVMQPGWWASHVLAEDLPTLVPAWSHLRSHASFTRDYRLRDGQGAIRHVQESLRRIDGPPGAPLRAVSTWTDISESKAHAAELSFVAHHDALTGLPNRILLQMFLAAAVQAGRPFAVVLVDLDRLRSINDSLGPAMGDQALRATAQRLQAALPADGFLARLSGDEFALVQPGGAEVDVLARDVLAAFERPLLGPAHPAVTTASVGIAAFPGDGDDADTLLKHAELALRESKRLGPGRFHVFEAALREDAEHRQAVESGLRVAMAQRQFRLHYQPQLDLRDGRVVGVEALVRWQHPEWGLVPPGQFISVAEDTGMIDEIGLWVLMEACRQLRAWDDAGLHVPCMAVNCSVKQLEGEHLPSQMAAVLAAAGLPGERLELELTESLLMRDPEHAIAALTALQAQGVRLSIDDFGTGHSSLAYLRRLPVTRLKIDRSFVSGIGKNPDDEQICRTVIELARNMHMETLAEGVEHPEEEAFLRAEGCELAQGFHYARPMPPEALAEWLQARRTVPPTHPPVAQQA